MGLNVPPKNGHSLHKDLHGKIAHLPLLRQNRHYPPHPKPSLLNELAATFQQGDPASWDFPKESLGGWTLLVGTFRRNPAWVGGCE